MYLSILKNELYGILIEVKIVQSFIVNVVKKFIVKYYVFKSRNKTG